MHQATLKCNMLSLSSVISAVLIWISISVNVLKLVDIDIQELLCVKKSLNGFIIKDFDNFFVNFFFSFGIYISTSFAVIRLYSLCIISGKHLNWISPL